MHAGVLAARRLMGQRNEPMTRVIQFHVRSRSPDGLLHAIVSESERLDAKYGSETSDDQTRANIDQQSAIVDTLIEMPAHTVGGAARKLSIVRRIWRGSVLDGDGLRFLDSVIADLERLAANGAA
jgi:hypothetical protein